MGECEQVILSSQCSRGRKKKKKKAFNGVMHFLVHHLTEMNPKKSLIVNSYFVQFSLLGFSPLVRSKRWATLYDAVIRNSSSVEMLLFLFSCNLSKTSNYQPVQLDDMKNLKKQVILYCKNKMTEMALEFMGIFGFEKLDL